MFILNEIFFPLKDCYWGVFAKFYSFVPNKMSSQRQLLGPPRLFGRLDYVVQFSDELL